ncbi:hypothetical protein FRC01_008037, partial [Tulasnella sp. 417]
PLFAVAISRQVTNPAPLASEPGGSFTIGAVDPSLFTGEIDYIDIPNGWNTWWLSPLTGITIGGSVLQIGTQLAAIDTGTTLIGGPTNVVEAIYAQIPGVERGTGDSAGYYFYPCETQINISFTFGNKSWPMNPADFPYDRQGDMCLGAIFAVDLGGGPGQIAPEWIVGDAFLKNVYSVYRYYPPAVGFAQLANPEALTQPQPALSVSVVSSPIPTNVLTLGGSQSAAGITVTSVEPFATGASRNTSNNAGSSTISRGTAWPWATGFLLEMVSSSAKSPVHTREHRERGQPLERKKLGLLEKKKDYVVRAKNYHTKRLRVERLKEKAKDRNKDEFYYAMKNQKTDRGVHISYRENQSLTTEIAKVLKAQDANYIRTMKRANLKRIASLKSQLTILADLVRSNSRMEDEEDGMDDIDAGDDDGSGESGSESDENESDDSEKREKKKEKEVLKIKVDANTPLSEKELEVLRGAGILPGSASSSSQGGQEGNLNGHIVFVEDEETDPVLTGSMAAWNYQPPKAGSSSKSKSTDVDDEEEPDLGWIIPADSKRKGKQRATESENALDPYAMARGRKQRTKLLKELSARLERDKNLRYAEQELEMQRLTMAGKGAHRKLKEKEQVFNEPEEDGEEYTFRRKNRMPVVELGNEVYKPKVFKWRQERKR